MPALGFEKHPQPLLCGGPPTPASPRLVSPAPLLPIFTLPVTALPSWESAQLMREAPLGGPTHTEEVQMLPAQQLPCSPSTWLAHVSPGALHLQAGSRGSADLKGAWAHAWRDGEHCLHTSSKKAGGAKPPTLHRTHTGQGSVVAAFDAASRVQAPQPAAEPKRTRARQVPPHRPLAGTPATPSSNTWVLCIPREEQRSCQLRRSLRPLLVGALATQAVRSPGQSRCLKLCTAREGCPAPPLQQARHRTWHCQLQAEQKGHRRWSRVGVRSHGGKCQRDKCRQAFFCVVPRASASLQMGASSATQPDRLAGRRSARHTRTHCCCRWSWVPQLRPIPWPTRLRLESPRR